MTNTREIIVSVSQKLFARFGLGKTTVEEIAKLAHIGKGTIYHHFKSKEQIFAEIIDKEFGFLQRKIDEAVRVAETPQEKLRAFVLTRMRYLREAVNYYGALKDDYLKHYSFIEKTRKESFQTELNVVRAILDEGTKSEVFAIDDPGLVAYAIIIALKGLEYPWTIEASVSDIDKDANTLVDLLFKGIERR
jgi:AcrR family transcriptional regulator